MAFVIPLTGLTVRVPGTYVVVPKDGMEVPTVGREGKYWKRRIIDGSLIICEKPKETVIDRKKGKNIYMEDKE